MDEGGAIMIRLMGGFGCIVAGVGLIEGSGSLALGATLGAIGSLLMLWGIAKNPRLTP